MHNLELRQYAKQNNVKLWRVAEKLGMQDSSFSRKLRHELPEEDRRKIMELIDQLAKGGEQE